jgi:hypothetical protein
MRNFRDCFLEVAYETRLSEDTYEKGKCEEALGKGRKDALRNL